MIYIRTFGLKVYRNTMKFVKLKRLRQWANNREYNVDKIFVHFLWSIDDLESILKCAKKNRLETFNSLYISLYIHVASCHVTIIMKQFYNYR